MKYINFKIIIIDKYMACWQLQILPKFILHACLFFFFLGGGGGKG